VLLDNLDCAFWALNLAGSADQAFFRLHRHGLLVLDFEHSDWASVLACSASSALVIVNYYLQHIVSPPYQKFIENLSSKIKEFRSA
jgi:hypothetical protein